MDVGWGVVVVIDEWMDGYTRSVFSCVLGLVMVMMVVVVYFFVYVVECTGLICDSVHAAVLHWSGESRTEFGLIDWVHTGLIRK